MSYPNHYEEYVEDYTEKTTYEEVGDDDSDGFQDYVETTVDPGPWFLVVTILVALLLVCSIPLLVWILEKLKMRRKRRRIIEQEFSNNRNIATEQDEVLSLSRQPPRSVSPSHSNSNNNTNREGELSALGGVAYFDTKSNHSHEETHDNVPLSPEELPAFSRAAKAGTLDDEMEVYMGDPDDVDLIDLGDRKPAAMTTLRPINNINDKDNHQANSFIQALASVIGMDSSNNNNTETKSDKQDIFVSRSNKKSDKDRATRQTRSEDNMALTTSSSEASKGSNLANALTFRSLQEEVDSNRKNSNMPSLLDDAKASPSSSEGKDQGVSAFCSAYLPNQLFSGKSSDSSPPPAVRSPSPIVSGMSALKSHSSSRDNNSNNNNDGQASVSSEAKSVASSVASSFLSFTGLAALGDMADEYLSKKEGKIYHNRGHDPRRVQGAGQVVQAVFRRVGGGGDSEHDGSISSKSCYSTTPRTQEPAIGGGGDDDNQDDLNDEASVIHVTSARQYKFYRCDGDMRKLLRLAIPFTLHSFASYVFEIMEVAVIGKLIGTNELSAYLIVDLLFSLSTMLLQGGLTSLFTLCSQAVGAGRHHLAGQFVQIGLFVTQATMIPIGIFWYFMLEDIVLLFGYEQEVADLAVSFGQIFYITLIFEVFSDAPGYLLEVIDHELYTATFEIITSAIEFFVVWYLAANYNISLRDVAVIQLVLEIGTFIFDFSFIAWKGWFADFWPGLIGSFALTNPIATRMFFKTAVPLSLGYVLSYGEWEILGILAGFMGPAEVSAWALLGNFWEAVEEVSEAVADAAEVKVANMLGSNQPVRAKEMAHKALFLGVIVSFVFSIPILGLQRQLPGWFTNDETLKSMLSDLFVYVCIGNIALMFGSMCFTLLGAQGRYALSTAIAFLGSWCVTLPLALLYTFAFDFDLQGLASAVVTGYSFSGALNAAVLLRSNWEKISNRVIKDTAYGKEETTQTTALKYDEIDWDDLPDFVQSAALVLGYNRRMWDDEDEPPLADESWSDLTAEQQKAAEVLGYSQQKWDDDGSDSSSSSSEADPESGDQLKVVDYNDCDWDELPPHVCLAAKSLGFTKKLWDSDQEPVTSDLDWKDLTVEQQNAALVLGYTEAMWDNEEEDKPVLSPCKNSEYVGVDWGDLPANVRTCARLLGHTKKSWNNYPGRETAFLDWDELSAEQRDAAQTIGYAREEWDKENEDAPKTCDQKQTDGFDEYDWEELPIYVRLAASSLGYGRVLWDQDKEPEISNLDWDELTPGQQKAAMIIGQTKAKWDEDDSKSSSKEAPPADNPVVLTRIASGHLSSNEHKEKKKHHSSKKHADSGKEASKNKDQAASVTNSDNAEMTSKPVVEPAEPAPASATPEVVSFEDFEEDDWIELPERVRTAAAVLGYTKKLWDKDKEPNLFDSDWNELTSAQQEAAMFFGYNQNKWDEE